MRVVEPQTGEAGGSSARRGFELTTGHPAGADDGRTLAFPRGREG